jgi:hypothetical protein
MVVSSRKDDKLKARNNLNILWACMFGIVTGALMQMSVKYPVSMTTITEANETCESHDGLVKLKVGLSGKVYYIECNDKRIFQFK